MKTYKPTILRDHEKTPEPRRVSFGCGEDKDGACGFWGGPYDTEVEALERVGSTEDSVIIRFNADGTDEILWRWSVEDAHWFQPEPKSPRKRKPQRQQLND